MKFFSDVGIRDCFVIQELLKEIAATNQLDASSQRAFKGTFKQSAA